MTPMGRYVVIIIVKTKQQGYHLASGDQLTSSGTSDRLPPFRHKKTGLEYTETTHHDQANLRYA